MKLIRHRFYRKEIIAAIWVGLILNFFGSTMLDGGFLGGIIFNGTIAFWVGSFRPLFRKVEIKTDRSYMYFGLIILIGFSAIISPIVWSLRQR